MCRHWHAPERLEPRTLLAVFTVITTADDGPGSLRQAILDANASPNTTPGADEVRFAIPGEPGTVHTLRPLSPLPAVTGPTTLDATTQPGYAGSPLIELDGSSAGANADGLVLLDRPAIVRGFTVNRFAGHGMVVRQPTPTPYRPDSRLMNYLAGNRVGTNPAGDVARPNGGAGILIAALETQVGGPLPGQANVISGNHGPGVWVQADLPLRAGPPPIRMDSNLIGTNASGTAALGNGREGVLLHSGYVDMRTNVISGNAASGVRASGTQALGYIVTSNIGTDASGTVAVSNGTSPTAEYRDGITLTAGAELSIIRNTISGNIGAGVGVAGANAQIDRNRIGTDASGNLALGNGGDGVRLVRAIPSSTVSGSLISANGRDGVRVESSERITLAGNRIGLNASRTAPLGNDGNGITLLGCRLIEVGMRPRPPVDGWDQWFVPPPPPNRIGGNAGHGIAIHGGLAAGVTSDISVFNNEIGYDNTTGVNLPNGGSGVYVAGARGVTIGPVDNVTAGNTIRGNRGSGVYVAGALGVTIGPADGRTTGNTIRGNDGDGVTVTDLAGTHSLNVRIIRNSIYDNGGIGIDLRPGPGVTPNDERDLDEGANHLQNFPTITGVERAGETTIVRFRLKVPARGFRVELFASSSPDAGAHGEGERFLGAAVVTTGVAGDVTATISVPSSAIPPRSWLTVTATDTFGNTSEFSPAVSATTARPVYRPPDRVQSRRVTAQAAGSVVFEPARRDPLTPRELLA
jgi:hypothetical protein